MAAIQACVLCNSPQMEDGLCVTENMFATKQAFYYRECASCQSLSLNNIPELSPFYPHNYYTNSGPEWPGLRQKLPILYRFLDSFSLKCPWIPASINFMAMMARLNISRNSSILDVGCGSGIFLRRLLLLGFTDLTGIDPYAVRRSNPLGIAILRLDLAEYEKASDVIFFHHSFEHTTSPKNCLDRARMKLSDHGFIVIRLPVRNLAFTLFRENWVQFDAPRHTFIPSVSGMRKLAERSGFEVESVIFDSTSFQFSGSLRYLLGKTLDFRGSMALIFLFGFVRVVGALIARMLNFLAMGDQAIFVLRKGYRDHGSPTV